MKKNLYALLASLLFALAQGTSAFGQVTIVAHRAIYEMTLASSTNRSGISGADGRLVMELTGSGCEGWSVTFRRVMELRPDESNVKLLDTQIASWESGDGLSMHMTQKEYIDNTLQTDTKLSAEIPDPKMRAAFMHKFGGQKAADASRSSPSSSAISAAVPSQQRFTPAQVERAETDLAQHLGAVARVVVKRAAAKARDLPELYLLLADEIEDPQEKKRFIRKAISVARPK